MTVEYRPTLEDVFRLKQALHRRVTRHPLLWTVFAGGCLIFIGGAMMASIGSAGWWLLALPGAAFAATAYAATRVNAPTLAKVEQEYAARAWVREPFRVEADADGLRYEHGPYRARAAWPAFSRVIETDHHLILCQRRSPGALAYGLAKRELERTPGGVVGWRRFIDDAVRKGKATSGPAAGH
jgi:hypothetical protein